MSIGNVACVSLAEADANLPGSLLIERVDFACID